MPAAQRELAEIMRGGLAFHGRIGGKDHLAHLALGEQTLELIEPEFPRPNAIEGRQMTHEHEVASSKTAGLLDRDDVGGRLDDAELCDVALLGGANGAQLALREHAAALAMPDRRQRLAQRLRERAAAVAVALQEIESHPLGGFGTDTGQAAQGIDQARERARVLH
jgi:hypothetical protein